MTHQPWIGDWRQRIAQRIGERGFNSVAAFDESAATATFGEIAKQLGDDVAPIQLSMLMREEAIERGQLDRFARSALVRFLADYLPTGWRRDKQYEYQRASAFADWIACLGEEYQASGERVWQAFLSAVDLDEGWRPTGPDDDRLRALFEKASFLSSSANVPNR